jgi:hypothetical protein
METIPEANLRSFLNGLKSQPETLAAALSFLELGRAERRRFIKELARACAEKKTIETNRYSHRNGEYLVQDGLLKTAAIAVAMQMHTEALGHGRCIR